MRNRKKIIYDFLPTQERVTLSKELRILAQNKNSEYIVNNSKTEILQSFSELVTRIDKQIILQIISHGNCDGFGPNIGNIVLYSELAETLRSINAALKNELILNLMTVCCSTHQLNFFNQGPNKLFQILVGSSKGAAIHGSIEHSNDVNNVGLPQLEGKINEINEHLDDDFSADRPETWTYLIVR